MGQILSRRGDGGGGDDGDDGDGGEAGESLARRRLHLVTTATRQRARSRRRRGGARPLRTRRTCCDRCATPPPPPPQATPRSATLPRRPWCLRMPASARRRWCRRWRRGGPVRSWRAAEIGFHSKFNDDTNKRLDDLSSLSRNMGFNVNKEVPNKKKVMENIQSREGYIESFSNELGNYQYLDNME